jgi:hypothetical protein
MQLFRPFRDHVQTASYLDDIRLNKQIVEAWQIANTCLVLMKLRQGGAPWRHHPVVKNIYNDGKPFLPELYRYMAACDAEWARRGKNRSSKFKNKLFELKQDILSNRDKFSWLPIRPYFNETIRDCDDVFECYRSLLREKWEQDKVVVKCSLPLAQQPTELPPGRVKAPER